MDSFCRRRQALSMLRLENDADQMPIKNPARVKKEAVVLTKQYLTNSASSADAKELEVVEYSKQFILHWSASKLAM